MGGAIGSGRRRHHPPLLPARRASGNPGRAAAVTMGGRPYGDKAFLIEVDDVRSAHRLAAAIEAGQPSGLAPAGIEGVVVGFRSVVVLLDLELGLPEIVESWVVDLVSSDATEWTT